MGKRIVATFDFDGTLTVKDSFKEFIKFSCGSKRLYLGILLNIHKIIAYKLGIYSNEKAKQSLFSSCFKGMSYRAFADYGNRFASQIDTMLNHRQHEHLKKHINNGDTTYIVSASIREWIEPWSRQQGVSAVIATEIEIDSNGCLTGRFTTSNCHGQEKVNRLLETEPVRDSYCLYAYGDSPGDKQLLAFSDFPTMVK